MSVQLKTPIPARWRVVVAAVTLLIVLALVVVHQLWWSKPTSFGGWGSEIGATLQVGVTTNINMISLPADDVTLREVEPALAVNSADADIEMVACRTKSTAQVGAADGSLTPYCAELPPVDGLKVPALADDLTIYARITPRRPGRIRIEGMNVTYALAGWRHLWRTGTEQTGIGIDITAK